MKISADQIDKKAIAGQTKDGKPIVYIATRGGLHAFFMKDEDGSISAIGAAPHRAIAKFLAGKKADIEWKEDFHKSEELEKSEEVLFQRLRSAIFSGTTGTDDKSGIFMVYDVDNKTIEIMKKEVLEEEIKEGKISKFALVRDTSLSSRVAFAKDCDDLEHLFEEER